MGPENQSYLRAVGWWAGLLLIGFLFWRYLVPYMIPFVIAGFMAALIDPLVSWLERLQVNRTAATLTGMVVIIGGTLFLVGLLVSLLVREVVRLTRELPALYHEGQQGLDRWLEQVSRSAPVHLPTSQGILNSQLSTAYHVTTAILQTILGVLVALPNALLVAVLALVAAFFLLRDKRVLAGVLEWLVPPGIRHKVPSLREEVVRGTLGFLRAQLFLVGTTALGTTLGLLLYGSRYAVLLGLFAGLLDLVPFLGATALLAPWAFVMFLTGQPLAGLELLTILAGVALVRQLIEPRLVSGGTGLHPLTALLALYVGIRLFGPVGFVIGPITAVVLKATARAARIPPFQV
jgi:sporulation integral membrane protein YtvI